MLGGEESLHTRITPLGMLLAGVGEVLLIGWCGRGPIGWCGRGPIGWCGRGPSIHYKCSTVPAAEWAMYRVCMHAKGAMVHGVMLLPLHGPSKSTC